MAYYALLDENNIVTQVISGIDENNTTDLPENFDSWEEFYADFHNQTCKRTSYNTKGNEHLEGGTAFRGNYAGVGYIYDEVNDVFYSEMPVQEGKTYTLDQNDWLWKEDT